MCEKKLYVFLDIDNTLVSSITTYEKEMCFEKIKGYYAIPYKSKYIIVIRHNLDAFLDWLFAHCNVCIWTAASKNYASFVIDNIIKRDNPDRKVHIFFHREHSDKSMKLYNHPKKLQMLWDKFNIDYLNKNNVVLIDDIESMSHSQNNMCIIIPRFDVTVMKDYYDPFPAIICRLKQKIKNL